VLAFDCGSVREIVDHGVTGGIVGNVQEAASAVRWLVQLDRKAVRRRFDRRFTSRRMADDYVRLYRASVEQHARDNIVPLTRTAFRRGGGLVKMHPSA
jgi:glycosyltransferase involved in cell wall biosynthesis